jgi:16S rRNA (guanine527-N7)-methyltransferase
MILLKSEAARFGINLTDQQLGQFDRYQALLLDWNERLNLTAITDPVGIRLRHFLDSLTCATVTGDLNGLSLIDVGTGAGFPGLPLKILYPAVSLVLVESVQKKTTFLEAVVSELGLTDVRVIAERAETLGRQEAHREQYDWAVARAVAAMPVLAEYLLPLCKVGGHLRAQKGVGAPEETEQGGAAIEALGGGIASLSAVSLPAVEQVHYLVVVPKVRPTPESYPRRVGMPGKRPIL